MKYISLLFIFLGCSSCLEIIDDIKINLDGSGTIKYTLNLSESKTKVNSILALDSLDGKKMPDIIKIKDKINEFEKLLRLEKGISNIKIEKDYENFMFRLSCDFKSISVLQNSLKKVFNKISEEKSTPKSNFNWLTWNENKLEREIPEISKNQLKKVPKKDLDKLRQGKYICITRFENEIITLSNKKAKLSKDKKAVMIQASSYDILFKPNSLNNLIELKEGDNR
ncbi:MAG: hypothetical protein P8I93_07675 [Crocinitomicaceae bacterium]|nr:hypothetical protein [Crocinitomicaceae bacterium]